MDNYIGTLRDRFAMAALNGLLSAPDIDLSNPFEKFAEYAYLFADAMLKAREKEVE